MNIKENLDINKLWNETLNELEVIIKDLKDMGWDKWKEYQNKEMSLRYSLENASDYIDILERLFRNSNNPLKEQLNDVLNIANRPGVEKGYDAIDDALSLNN